MKVLVRVVALTCCLTLLAGSVARAGQPIHVIAFSLDPSLLQSAGLTVNDLKLAAVARLKEEGFDAAQENLADTSIPRLAIAVPAIKVGDEIVAFLHLEYETPARTSGTGMRLLYATTWSKWWGGHARKEAFAADLKRGLKVLVEDFVTAQRKGEL